MGNQLTEIAPNTQFLPSFQSLHVVVIGLDSAGKTSLLYRLKLREFVETIPTKGFNMEIARSAENQGVPVLVLANKQDLDQAMSASEVEKVLALHELSSSTLHHAQGCSALDGQGLQSGLEKLYEMILKRKKMLRHSKKKR
uniref:ADP-ribosylation factor-like protein 4D n=1 Tax=Scophthalmus maximus TaxID=52904 RepID=A0A8D3BXG1_SCOMX